MLHSQVKLNDLITYEDCSIAINRIENNFKNYTCTLKDWIDGRQCDLKKGAIAKIKLIEQKQDQFPDECY